MSKRAAHVTEVRLVRPEDGEFLQLAKWVAIDSEGRKFGGATEDDARQLATDYNHPPRRSGA
jgi:hypothetical protein